MENQNVIGIQNEWTSQYARLKRGPHRALPEEQQQRKCQKDGEIVERNRAEKPQRRQTVCAGHGEGSSRIADADQIRN